MVIAGGAGKRGTVGREEVRIYGLCPREALKFVIYGPMIRVQSACEDSHLEGDPDIYIRRRYGWRDDEAEREKDMENDGIGSFERKSRSRFVVESLSPRWGISPVKIDPFKIELTNDPITRDL